MSPEECRTVDWYEQGHRDGQRGQPRSYAENHREACAKVGVALDMPRYQAGRDLGIKTYCTPEVGLQEGRLGRSYQNVCPPALEPRFLERYRAGYRVHQAEQRVDDLDREQRNKEHALRKAKDDHTRSRLRRDLRDLDQRLRRARNEVYDAERWLR